MQQLSLKKLSHSNNSTFKPLFEVSAFFLLEALIAIMVAAMMAGVLSVLVSYTASYSARTRLMSGALEVASSTLDAIIYGSTPLGGNRIQGDYAVSVDHTPNQHAPEAVAVRVSWLCQGRQEQLELASVIRKA